MSRTPEHPDARLLRSFANDRSEASFGELVGRYTGLVYGVALRRVGGPLADEVVQNVFLILARKAAKLDASEGIGAWLHKVAVGESLNAARKESNRTSAMKRYAKELPQSASRTNESHLLSVLDESLASLRRTDRRYLLMRFFDSLSYGEIARQIGTTEEAGRKRVSRALGRLANAMRRRDAGVVPVASVGTLLGVQLPQQAPAALVASVTSTAAAGTATVSGTISVAIFSKIVALMKTSHLAFAASLAIAASVPFAVQWHAHGKTGLPPTPPLETADEARSSSAAAAFANGTIRTRPRGRQLDLAALARRLSELDERGRPYEKSHALQVEMFALRREDLETVADLLAGHPNQNGLWSIFDAFYARWAEFEPEAALAHAAASGSMHRSRVLAEVANVWAVSEPGAAVAWIRGQPEDVVDASSFYYRWAERDPETALGWMGDLGGERNFKARKHAVITWAERDADAALAWVLRLGDETMRSRLTRATVFHLARQVPAKGFHMAVKVEDPIQRPECLRFAVGQWVRQEPLAAAKAFLELPVAEQTNSLAQEFSIPGGDFSAYAKEARAAAPGQWNHLDLVRKWVAQHSDTVQP